MPPTFSRKKKKENCCHLEILSSERSDIYVEWYQCLLRNDQMYHIIHQGSCFLSLFQAGGNTRKFMHSTFLHNTALRKLQLPECVKPPATRQTFHSHDHSLAQIFRKLKSSNSSIFPKTMEDWDHLSTQKTL